MEYAPNSRYYGIPTAVLEEDGKEPATYLQRRFLPKIRESLQLPLHTIEEGDRLDILSNRFLGDPLLFWRVCDANYALKPEELTDEIGRQIRIPLLLGG